ncbi:facilitated trehalose transporter Tret1-like [Athalia rosae]|uniref:facilitated trehalose transporter Tret1-like n=1 Tax=Athalia rosae TaxID=37344 RepID=UPI0020339AD0|nr:facilitated trehalose transporter Tret1-like [Athalia rosae]
MTRDSEKGKYTTPEGSPVIEYAASFACCMIIFGVGTIAGFNSPAVSILISPDSPIPLSGTQASTLAAVVGFGHMIAPMVTVYLVDKLGRKASLLASTIPVAISFGIVAIAESYIVLLIGRLIGGLALGLGFAVVPIYLGEIASAKLRGALGTLTGSSMSIGLLFSYVIIPYLNIRRSAYVEFGIAVATAIGVCFVPESPYFLAVKNKFEEAEAVLEKLRGKTDVTEELELVKETVKKQSEVSRKKNEGETGAAPRKFNDLRELFGKRANRRAFLINSLFITVFQTGGYTVVLVYGSVILRALKITIDENFASIIIAVIPLCANIVASFIIDKLGRRPLVFVSGVLCGTCTLIISVYFFLMEYKNIDVSAYSNVILFAVFSFVTAFNIGLMPVQFVVVSETLASEIKALASLLVGVIGGLLATLALKFYLMTAITWNLGHSVPFLGFSILNYACTALILKYLPETKGKTFIEIQRELSA